MVAEKTARQHRGIMTSASTISFDTAKPRRLRVFLTACGAHALHDGLTDTLYVLLPIFQAVFGINYAAIGVLRALYAGSMAGLQVPSAALARRVGPVGVLVIGTAIAGAGYLCLGAAGGLVMLGLALVLGGIGSSTQHPIASSLIASAYEGQRSRDALGTYNFAGDLGKVALPALAACLIALISWRATTAIVGAVALAGAAAIMLALRDVSPQSPVADRNDTAPDTVRRASSKPKGGFPLLLVIGIVDSATRMSFLTFLPFLLKAKGAGIPEIGVALSLLFAGGAAGKLVCGFLGGRLGVLPTVLITEGGTALTIMALLPLPLSAAFFLLPVVGVALNGTSSVLYGTVPELVPTEKRETAFGVFYTATIGAGALSPIVYGFFGDANGLSTTTLVIAAVVLVTLPLAWLLNPMLEADDTP
jgi:FSR family fosmidomycin resistance protein-like MFS transporter